MLVQEEGSLKALYYLATLLLGRTKGTGRPSAAWPSHKGGIEQSQKHFQVVLDMPGA
jgi:hypothetical protein